MERAFLALHRAMFWSQRSKRTDIVWWSTMSPSTKVGGVGRGDPGCRCKAWRYLPKYSPDP